MKTIIATLALAAAFTSMMAHGQALADDNNHGVTVPLMLAAGSEYGQSFVRIYNFPTGGTATVRIIAVDDGGNVYDPVTIQLGVEETIHFNSDDLTDGNAAKGIEGIGSPRQGDWRLRVESSRPVRVQSYVRTRDGFLTATHDVLPFGYGAGESTAARLAVTFNPASNTRQQSRLRLINFGDSDETVRIRALDDAGNHSGRITLTLPPRQSRTLTAVDLEQGAHGLEGALGDGTGKWRVYVSSDPETTVAQSLIYSTSGHISNLSAEGYLSVHDDRLSSGDGDSGGDACNMIGDCAPTLPLDGQQSGRIYPEGDVDYFRLTVKGHGDLRVYTESNMDTGGVLYSSNGYTFAADSVSGSGGNFRIDHIARPCTYFVYVEETEDRTGSYTLHTEFEPSDFYGTDDHPGTGHHATPLDLECAANLPLGGNLSGTIDVEDDSDVFRINVTESGTLIAYATSDIETIGWLDSRESQYTLAYGDYGYDGRNFRLEHEVEPGEYFLTVAVDPPLEGKPTIGEYTVHAEFDDGSGDDGESDDHGNGRGDATTMDVEGQQTGRLEEAGDVDWFRVNISESGTLYAYATGSFDAVLTLYDSAGTPLQRGAGRHEYEVDEGTYFFLSVEGDNYHRVGDYTLHTEFRPDDHGNGPRDATTIDVPGQQSGRIDYEYDADVFRVSVTESGTLTTYTTGDVDWLSGALYDSDYNLLAYFSPSQPDDHFRIEHEVDEGTYFVNVSRRLIGDYTIHVEFEPN